MVYVITSLTAWQLYHVESLHPPGHSLTITVVRAMIREALFSSKVHLNIIPKAGFSSYKNMRVVIVEVCGDLTKSYKMLCLSFSFYFCRGRKRFVSEGDGGRIKSHDFV